MTRDEIGELIAALPQGLDANEFIYRLINWAVDREREACAKVCDQIMQQYKANTTLSTEQNLIGYMAAEVCGVRIRERGQK